MTDLFTVTIDAIEGSTLHGRVHMINSDIPVIPQEDSFPLALLTDAWFHLKNGYLSDGGGMPSRRDRYPLSEERGKEIVAGMRLGNELQELYDRKNFTRRAADIVTSYGVGPIHNVPLWSEVAAFNDPNDPWEPGEREEFAEWEGAAELTEYRTVVLMRTRPFDKRPYADIVVTVKDPGYLEHMTAGMRWSTAAAWNS